MGLQSGSSRPQMIIEGGGIQEADMGLRDIILRSVMSVALRGAASQKARPWYWDIQNQKIMG